MTKHTKQAFEQRLSRMGLKELVSQVKLLETSFELLEELLLKYLEKGKEQEAMQAERRIADIYQAHFLCVDKLKNSFGIEYRGRETA